MFYWPKKTDVQNFKRSMNDTLPVDLQHIKFIDTFAVLCGQQYGYACSSNNCFLHICSNDKWNLSCSWAGLCFTSSWGCSNLWSSRKASVIGNYLILWTFMFLSLLCATIKFMEPCMWKSRLPEVKSESMYMYKLKDSA